MPADNAFLPTPESVLQSVDGLETVLNDAEIWLDDLKEMRDRKHEASVLVYISSL